MTFRSGLRSASAVFTALFAVVALAAAVFAQGRGAVDQSSLGAISGGVLADASAGPVPGAVVTLTNGSLAISLHTTTDSQGRYVFLGLPPGDGYRLRARHAGMRADARSLGLTGPGIALQLSSGMWVRDVTLGLTPLGAIAGVIRDEQGRPLARMHVRLLSSLQLGERTLWSAAGAGETDDRGEYRFTGLSAGDYVVAVPGTNAVIPADSTIATARGLPEPPSGSQPQLGGITLPGSNVWLTEAKPMPPTEPGEALRVYAPAFHPASTTLSSAAVVQLAHGAQREGVDVTLVSSVTSSVSGVIAGPQGTGGLSLRLRHYDGTATSPLDAATTVTDRAGRFRFAGVIPGSYVLEAPAVAPSLVVGSVFVPHTPGLVPGTMLATTDSARGPLALRTPVFSGGKRASVRERLDVGVSPVENIEVHLTSGTALRGTISRDDGLPLGEVTLMIEPVGAEAADGPVAFRTPPAFDLSGLGDGQYLLDAQVRSLLVRSVSIQSRDVTDQAITLADARGTDDVHVVLTSKYAIVRGTVTAAPEHPETDVAVMLFSADPAQWVRSAFSPRRIAAHAGRTGHTFEFRRMPAGEYLLAAVPFAHLHAWRTPGFLESLAPTATRLRVGWGESVEQAVTLQEVVVR